MSLDPRHQNQVSSMVGLGDFCDCENNRDVVFIIMMLMSTFHNRDCVIPLRFVL